MDHQLYSLKNGIRIILNPVKSAVSHCCLIINAGSRDEEAGRPGLAHFIEHLFFKQTKKRNTNQILNRLEIVGGDLNAYTTKEYTCLQASFLEPHLERAIDLLQDIAFFSTFPSEEMGKEKDVILDEIASYEDQPEEAINDDFESLIFAGHTLGENILGTPETVKAFARKDVTDFIAQNYNTHQMIFAVSGSYTLTKVARLAEKYFGIIPENTQIKQRNPPQEIKPINIIQKRPINQSHCMIGTKAYGFHHQNKTGLLLLNNLLGGTGMSSRLNLEVREKHGIAYTIESNYSPLSDTGIFSIYFGTDTEKVAKATKLVHKELRKLRENKLGVIQLAQAKQRFIGQIALGEENRMGVLISMAKSLLDYDKIDSLTEVFRKINNVSKDDLINIANDIFSTDKLSTLVFEPEN
ncbi:insulinase family protein [Pedobacter sp. SD-b]|uniref:Insulinase family protein n=1 Tax=Pedobacter segetis TaxID=2793069 RepID=A0ABS1BEY3_9SPHI|nr:pitrilysin family protein [Pedobacter segetis]MBK0381419.1 insulinase family protein [Pedobacter segetis]